MTEFVDPKSKIKEAQELDYVADLWSEVERRAPPDAAILLRKEDTQVIIQVLKKVRPRFALKVLQGFPKELRKKILP